MDVGGERNQTLLCLLDGDAWLESTKRREKARAAICLLFRSERQWLPDVDRAPKHRVIETGRHNADDLHGLPVELNFSSEYVWVVSKMARPKSIAQDYRIINTRLEFFGFKYTTVRGCDSHQWEEIRGRFEADQAFGCLPGFGESNARVSVGRHVFKDAILGALVEEIRH